MGKIYSHCNVEGNCLGRKINGNCYFPSDSTISLNQFLDSFPSLVFEMENDFDFIWSPHDYMYSDDGVNYCLPFIEISYLFTIFIFLENILEML